MDIVQYLHGLVSSTLGVLGDHSQADLLKQYYALSVAHLANQSFDITNPDNRQLHALWGEKTPALVRCLSRSFHLSETQTQSLLEAATPPMLAELSTLNHDVANFIQQNFADSSAHLPAWSAQFVQLPKFDAAPETLTHQTPSTPKPTNTTKKSISPLPVLFGVLIGALTAGIGAGAWYMMQSKTDDSASVQPASTTNATALPRLSMTAGENNTLYACHAQIGNQALQNQLLQILQNNFGSVNCIMQINEHFAGSLAGLERLDSIIAMIKSEPFTSIEIVGEQIFVNSPNPQVIARMVNDIKLLAPQFDVLAATMPNKATAINQSIERATRALNALSSPINAHDLSWAMSLQILDFNGTSQLPSQNQALLALAAQKLKESPDIKLIIATHTDASNPDRMANISLSQAQAEAVRAFLLEQGVAEGQLVAKGVGDAFAIADNITELGKFTNRRTEFLVFDNGVLSALSNSAINIDTPTMTAPIQAAMPVIPPSPPIAPAMPAQGMPSGVVAPEPVYQAQPLLPATPPNHYPNATMPAPTPAPNVRELPKGAPIPKEVLELSQTVISSEDNAGGTSYEEEIVDGY